MRNRQNDFHQHQLFEDLWEFCKLTLHAPCHVPHHSLRVARIISGLRSCLQDSEFPRPRTDFLWTKVPKGVK